MNLMILDGNSIVNRAFYGVRPLNAPDGTPTNAVYGFLAILRRLLDEIKPEALCVTFDLKAPTFRHKACDFYKAQRKPMPEDLAAQMPVLKKVLDAMGIRRYELEGYEADDLLGTASAICEKKGWQCTVVTGDKDSLQLISRDTTVCSVRTIKGQTETIMYTPERFFEEYGFEPIRMIDLKALMGDSSDNIPGVPGIGEKTATELIRRYESIDRIYAGLDGLEIKEGARKKLREGEDSARQSYWLATIVRDAPFDFAPDENLWNENYTGELYGLFKRLGFNKFIEKWNIQPQKEAENAPEVFTGECEMAEIGNEQTLDAVIAKLSGKSASVVCGAELEWVMLDVCDECTAYSLERDSYAGDYEGALKKLFSADIKKTGHNIKNIQRGLLERNIPAEEWEFDTALAAYLLDATAGSYETDTLCMKYCGFEPYKAGSTGEEQLSLLDTDEDKLSRAQRLSERASLAAALECLREAEEKKLSELKMTELYEKAELPLCRVLADMEHQGFLVDKQALHDFGESLNGSIYALQQSIWSYAGSEFNINSPKQLGEVLFEKLMLPSGKKTKTGWSTNADVLEKLKGKHPIVDEVLDYRMLTKLKSTYADGLIKVIDADGRIRTDFQMTVTATGRLSSTEPNLQNIPIRKAQGAQIRKMFVAGPGNVLVDADYSQIELRLLAHISGDKAMQDAFLSGEDFHAVTASNVFSVPLAEVTPTLRSRAKAVNFGIVYGISAYSLSQDIGVFPNEAKAYMEAYMDKYHGVRDYMKSVVEKAKADGFVSTMYGRRRSLPELSSSNFNTRSFGERVALNMPVQGTAADIIKIAMVNVFNALEKEGLKAKLILQVHDELIVECPEDEAERVCAILRREMEGAAHLAVPLTVEAKIGKSWAEAH